MIFYCWGTEAWFPPQLFDQLEDTVSEPVSCLENLQVVLIVILRRSGTASHWTSSQIKNKQSPFYKYIQLFEPST